MYFIEERPFWTFKNIIYIIFMLLSYWWIIYIIYYIIRKAENNELRLRNSKEKELSTKISIEDNKISIEDFEKKCLEEKKITDDKLHEWDIIRKHQEYLGESYEPKNGCCPKCKKTLFSEKEFLYGFWHKIYLCNCGYKYAVMYNAHLEKWF